MFIFCDKCGAKNNDTAVFCRECGNSLALKDDEEEVKDTSSEEKKEDTKEETVSEEKPSEENPSEEKKEDSPSEENPSEESDEEDEEDEYEDNEPVTEVLYDPNKAKEESSEDNNDYEDEDEDEKSESSEKEEGPVEEEYEDEDEDDKKVETFPQLDELHNPSTDTYWDDVIPEIEEEIYQIPKDIIIKAVVGTAILIVFIVMLIIMI